MRMIKCEKCGRLVPAERRVKAFMDGLVNRIQVYFRAFPHLEDMTATSLSECPGAKAA